MYIVIYILYRTDVIFSVNFSFLNFNYNILFFYNKKKYNIQTEFLSISQVISLDVTFLQKYICVLHFIFFYIINLLSPYIL